MKFVYPRQIFEKYSYIKFHANQNSESRLFHAEGRTDGLT